MSLPANSRRDRYVANQGQTVFPYTFRIFAASDLVVERLRNNTTTTLQLNTDYTVSGVGNDTGGNVTLTQGAAAGDIIAIVSAQPNQRSTDFTESGDFRAAAVNAEFDRIWIGIQQVAQDVSRQITRPLSDPTASYVLPPAAVRANRYLAFGADGSLTFPVPQPAGPGTTEAYWWGGTAGGTANALTISVGGPPTAYAEGQRFAFVVASNNTGAATLNVNGLGAKSIRRPDGSTLQAGDLKAGMLIGVTYDGTNFRLASAWATNAEATAGTNNTAAMTPLRVAEAISALSSWQKIVDAAIANSTTIDVTGFSIQNYRMVVVHLLGARLSSSAAANTTFQLYRNNLLVTTGYEFVRETVVGSGSTAGTTTGASSFNITSSVDTAPLLSTISVVQLTDGQAPRVLIHTAQHDNSSNPALYRVSGVLNSGSAWVDGIRITAPAAFQAGIGRLVVMGLRP
jgi:hypothetical protein